MLNKIKLSTVVSGFFILASAFALYVGFQLKYWSSKYAPGPGFIPRWVCGAMLILSIIAFIQSFKEEGITLAEALPKDPKCRMNLFLCWACLIFFYLAVKRLGFVVTSSIVLATLFSRGTKWKIAIPLSIVVSLICFFVFKVLLQVQIPTNVFGW